LELEPNAAVSSSFTLCFWILVEVNMTLPSYAMNQPTFPEMYERWLAPSLFRLWAELTLDEVNLAAGDRLLDIACGTGVVARVAKQGLGDGEYVVGVDVSPDMLTVARAVAPEIDWGQGNAADLPIKDEEKFEVVVCQQGLQFFSDKAAAVAQVRRALLEGGRLAVSTWRSDNEIPFFRELRALESRLKSHCLSRRSAHVGQPTDARLMV
jgi:ubiquinone/menaquinone biosynthesis C-methylase UbiE